MTTQLNTSRLAPQSLAAEATTTTSSRGTAAARRPYHGMTIETPLQCTPSVDRYLCTLAPVCRRIIANVHGQQRHQSPPLSYSYRVSSATAAPVDTKDNLQQQHVKKVVLDDGNCQVHDDDEDNDNDDDDDNDSLSNGHTEHDSEKVVWRDEHAAPFSWRSASQECLARQMWPDRGDPLAHTTATPVIGYSSWTQRRSDGPTLAGSVGGDSEGRRGSLQHTVSFNLRQSIRKRVSKLEKLYQGGWRHSQEDSDTPGVFEHPSLVVSASQSCDHTPPSANNSGSSGSGNRQASVAVTFREHVMAGLSRGRRVLLSIRPRRDSRSRRSVSPLSPIRATSAAAPASAAGRSSFVDVEPAVGSWSSSHGATFAGIGGFRRRRARSAAPSLQRVVITASATAAAEGAAVSSANGAADVTPPGGSAACDAATAASQVYADMVAIRTGRTAHATSLRTVSRQLACAARGGDGDEPGYSDRGPCGSTFQQQPLVLLTTPPLLRRVAPPVVPSSARFNQSNCSASSSSLAQPQRPAPPLPQAPPTVARTGAQAPPLPQAPPSRHRLRRRPMSPKLPPAPAALADGQTQRADAAGAADAQSPARETRMALVNEQLRQTLLLRGGRPALLAVSSRVTRQPAQHAAADGAAAAAAAAAAVCGMRDSGSITAQADLVDTNGAVVGNSGATGGSGGGQSANCSGQATGACRDRCAAVSASVLNGHSHRSTSLCAAADDSTLSVDSKCCSSGPSNCGLGSTHRSDVGDTASGGGGDSGVGVSVGGAGAGVDVMSNNGCSNEIERRVSVASTVSSVSCASYAQHQSAAAAAGGHTERESCQVSLAAAGSADSTDCAVEEDFGLSVLLRPVDVGIKTGFDFLDNW